MEPTDWKLDAAIAAVSIVELELAGADDGAHEVERMVE
jgi:hypothetical protein